MNAKQKGISFCRDLAIGLCLSTNAWAAFSSQPLTCPLRIFHTNDLHSYFERGEDSRLGNYAALKHQLNQLQEQANRDGIPFLTLDAGDFSEGGEFFFADRGRRSFQMMNDLGYDAVTIGNHDWLIGVSELGRILLDVRPRFAFLGANVVARGRHPGLSRYLKPYFETTRGPARIAVLGLTTNEIFFSWRVQDGFIYAPTREADLSLPSLKANHDFVIALTHIGQSEDVRLVMNTSGLDLVVGGHSHDTLPAPKIVRDRRGKSVPILQAGAHGEYIGNLLVDACPGSPLRIASYQLVPIYSAGKKDSQMVQKIKIAREAMDTEYGREWLDEPIARVPYPLEPMTRTMIPKKKATEWGTFVAETFREVGNADIGFDVGEFGGAPQPSGLINRRQVLSLYPHLFEIDKRMGWTIWTVEMKGSWIKRLLKSIEGSGYPSAFVGVRDLEDGRIYKIAIPEGLARGPGEVTSFSTLIVKRPTDTRVPIWTALERRLNKIFPPLQID